MSMANRALNIGNNMNKLPDEIMEQILLLVPVEDLANFKTLWFSILTNPRFIYSKLKFDWPPLLLASSSFTAPYLLTIGQEYGSLIFTLHRPFKCHDHVLYWYKTTLWFDLLYTNILVGHIGENQATCIHGLICFNNFPSVYICNPLTREFVTAPEPNISSDCGTFLVLLATGFGFCSSINKYKIVRVCRCRCEDHASINPWGNHNRAEILTLGNDESWRTIKLWGGPCLPMGKALIIDNVMYWKTAPKKMVIELCSFDICMEEFKVIKVSVPGLFYELPYELIELKGKLCVVQNLGIYPNHDETKFYVPKDMTKLEDWVMKVELQIPHPKLRGFVDKQISLPLGIIHKNIYVMRLSHRGMAFFDLKSGRLLRSDPSSGPCLPLNVVPYVPSLVRILPS